MKSIQYSSSPLSVSTPSSSACTISSACAAESTALREKRSMITPAQNIEGKRASPKAKSWAATAVFDPVRSKARKARTTPAVIMPRNWISVAVQSRR